MSVLFLLISALVLIYLGIGGKSAAAVLVIATIAGFIQDDWHLLSLLFGGGLLALALLLIFPGDLRLDNWVQRRVAGPAHPDEQAGPNEQTGPDGANPGDELGPDGTSATPEATAP